MKRYMMKMLCVPVVGLLLSLTGCQEKNEKQTCFSPIIEVPFDESMGKSEMEFRFIFANADDASRYTKLKALYEKNLPSKIERSATPKIPKIIHQIWVGPRMPPNYFYDFQEKWKALHPGWEYHLWNDEALEKLNLENWDLVCKTPNWAEKSDIIRGDLLNRFGGVYMDDDCEPLHCLDELNDKYDFYAGMEPPHKIATTNNRFWAGISIMAARPGHPIIQNWRSRIRNVWDDVEARYSTIVERDLNQTYFTFTYAVMQEIDKNGNVDIIFPATYFYPLSAENAAKRRNSCRAVRERMYDMLENLHLKRPRAYSRSYPETLSVHYWGNKWLPTAQEHAQEMQRAVDGARKDVYDLKNRVRVLEKQLANTNQVQSTVVEKQAAPQVLEATAAPKSES